MENEHSSGKKLKVLIADNKTLVSAGLRHLLEKTPGVDVVGEATIDDKVAGQVESKRPDVLLINTGSNGMHSLEMTVRLLKKFPKLKVAVFSIHANADYVVQAMKSGVKAFLPQRSSSNELEAALKALAKGDTYLSHSLTKKTLDTCRRQSGAVKSPFERLTPRQRAILKMIAEGWHTKEIASRLRISAKTVEFHRMRLMTRLDIFDIPGLVRYALRVGLIPLDS